MSSQPIAPVSEALPPAVSEAERTVPSLVRPFRRRPSEANRRTSEMMQFRRQARGNLRRHFARAARRVLVLAVADLLTFWLVRAALRAVRDAEVIGVTVARMVGSAMPPGPFLGWQFPVALGVGLVVTGNYSPGDRRRDVGRLFAGCALAVGLPLWGQLWTRELAAVLVQYGLTTMLVWIGLSLERLTIDRVVGLVRDPTLDAARTLLVGNVGDCRLQAAGPAFSDTSSFRVVGFADVSTAPDEQSLGCVDDLANLVRNHGVDTVAVCGHVPDRVFHQIVDASLASGCHLITAPQRSSVAGVEPTVFMRGGQALLEFTRPALRGQQLVLKRLLDVAGSIGMLVLFAPVLLLISLVVMLDSAGSPLFGHRRLGRHGRIFRCLKFRSMHRDAEERLRLDPILRAQYVENHFKLPVAADPRLTRVGRLLRGSSLDELPQLLNVLWGDMSLVGPRPIVPEELGQYGEWADLFLSLKPGMTGAWAVSGRSEVGYPDRSDLELAYVRGWSLRRDIAILFRTLPAVLRRRGAH